MNTIRTVKLDKQFVRETMVFLDMSVSEIARKLKISNGTVARFANRFEASAKTIRLILSLYNSKVESFSSKEAESFSSKKFNRTLEEINNDLYAKVNVLEHERHSLQGQVDILHDRLRKVETYSNAQVN
jgi:transcriptional regulator with XRE-family HTH domain